MSDTPRADDAVMRAVSQGMRLAPLADFARELERENATLRSDYAELRRENAMLRSDLGKCNNLSEIRFEGWHEEKELRLALAERVSQLERENAALQARFEEERRVRINAEGVCMHALEKRDQAMADRDKAQAESATMRARLVPEVRS